MPTLEAIAPDALIIGIDPATIHLGLAAMRIADATPHTLLTLNAPKRQSVAQRLDLLVAQLTNHCTSIQANGTVMAVAIEEPSDYFEEDSHTTAFVLGRAFERCWLVARTLQVPVYIVAPAEASVAVGCARKASKDTRGKAVKRILGSAAIGAGPDACDAYATATAGYGQWQVARLRAAVARAVADEASKPPTSKKRSLSSFPFT